MSILTQWYWRKVGMIPNYLAIVTESIILISKVGFYKASSFYLCQQLCTLPGHSFIIPNQSMSGLNGTPCTWIVTNFPHIIFLIIYIFQPIVLMQKKMFDSSIHDTIKEVMQWLEDYVTPTGFVARSKDLTVADLAILSNYTTLRACGVIPTKDYPKVEAWAERCQKLVKNYEKANGKGAEGLGQIVKDAIAKISST